MTGFRVALSALAVLWQIFLGTGLLPGYPLTDAQQHRLEQYLPLTLQKLQRHMPVHVALIGDEVAGMSTLDERNGNVFFSMHGFFLQGLEREFFYTGGVKWLNPPADVPPKLHGHRGDEITLETFTWEGATALHALQALTTRVFLRHTDLVLLQVGLNDYRNGGLLDSVAISVAQALAICRAQGAELVLVGPAPLREGDLLREWGGIRQVTSELRRTAEELGIMFLDPALELMRTRPASREVSLEERTLQLSSALRMELVDYGPGKEENARINARAHKRAGQGIFRQFLNGPSETKLRLDGGATRTGPDGMRLDLVVENPGALGETGILAPLNAAEDWEPAMPAIAINLEPGEKASFAVEYQRKKAGKGGEGGPAPRKDRVTSGKSCFPFLYSGLDEAELLERVVAPAPVAIRWDYTALRGVEKQFPLTFVLCNPGDQTARGSYEIIYDRQRAKGSFQVDARAERAYTAQCALPATGDQLRRTDAVVLTITCGDVTFEERRSLEISRNLALGQKVSMARLDCYAEEGTDGQVEGGVKMELQATADSLRATFDLGDRVLEEEGGRPSLQVELTLDGRPDGERHEFGFVSPLRIAFGAKPGAGEVAPIEPGCFGNFYGKILSEAGVQALLGIREDGLGRTVTVRVPRIYLYRHEWQLGKADCTLGISARLRFLQVNPGQQSSEYPASREWVTGSGAYGEWQAGGLAALELATNPSSRWSVRLY